MGSQLTHGSLFAGIMGFGEGFRRAGLKDLWAVEIEPFCRAVIRTQFPGTELFEDVRQCGKSNLRPVDVLTAGFPCQDLSVAGKRAGLGGSRSGLFWEVVRILGELEPAWFVLENVPGLFSSNEGRDFAMVLNALDELGYGLAWRVLNSQFFGVAQRRRRVFIVGRFGKPCPAEILFEPESGHWDSQESGETREDVAFALAARAGGTGSDSSGLGNGWNTTYPVVNAISSSAGHHGHSSPRGDGSDNIIVSTLLSGENRTGGTRPPGSTVDNADSLIVASLSGMGSGGPDDNDGQAGRIVSSPTNSDGMRDFARLPKGLDSARYRALGNAVTANVAEWIGKRIVALESSS